MVLSLQTYSINQMNIKVFTRSNWGNTHTYILDDNINDAVMTLTKKKTIDRYDIRALEALGHTIEIVLDPSLSVDRASLVA